MHFLKFLLVIVLLVSGACGVKGPPLPPEREFIAGSTILPSVPVASPSATASASPSPQAGKKK